MLSLVGALFFHLLTFIYIWLFWVFSAARAFLQLSRAGATLQLRRTGFLWWLLLRESVQASAVLAPGLQNTGSVVVAHGLGCSKARGILPDPESKPTSPTLAGRLPTTEHPGKPEGTFHSEFLLVCFFLTSSPQTRRFLEDWTVF